MIWRSPREAGHLAGTVWGAVQDRYPRGYAERLEGAARALAWVLPNTTAAEEYEAAFLRLIEDDKDKNLTC